MISITEAQALTFPTIGIPSSGSVYLAVSSLNSSTSGTAQIIAGAANRGAYALSAHGEGGISISIDISVTNAGTSGVTLNAFEGLYDANTTIGTFPSSTLPLPAKKPATTPLYIGAILTADSTVQTGSYTGAFDIIVFVQ